MIVRFLLSFKIFRHSNETSNENVKDNQDVTESSVCRTDKTRRSLDII